MESIGIIGYGNMGSCIAQQLTRDYLVYVFDKDSSKISSLKDIKTASAATDLVDKVSVVILAVKPQDFDDLLKEIRDYIKDKLIISIAAGINISYIEKVLNNARVIRVMPNIITRIGEGISCLAKGNFATETDLDFAQKLFGYMGKTLKIKEEMMDAATAISGSGPAYVCEYIETHSLNPDNIPEEKKQDFLDAFKKAAKKVGFNDREADLLVETTFEGTINFLKKTKISTAQLKDQVASKGGTTEAALKVYKGIDLELAVKSALKRAKELSKR